MMGIDLTTIYLENEKKIIEISKENEKLHFIIKEIKDIITEHFKNKKYLGNIYSDKQILEMIFEKLENKDE